MKEAEASADAGPLTCKGKIFGTPVRVGTAQISGALATTMWGLRVVGPNAYFAATPAGSSEQQLFRATFTPGVGGGAPALSNASVLTPPSSTTTVEWAPSVSTDSALLVFATAFPPPWVSDDGCEVLLGGGNISSINDIYYARRTSQ